MALRAQPSVRQRLVLLATRSAHEPLRHAARGSLSLPVRVVAALKTQTPQPHRAQDREYSEEQEAWHCLLIAACSAPVKSAGLQAAGFEAEV